MKNILSIFCFFLLNVSAFSQGQNSDTKGGVKANPNLRFRVDASVVDLTPSLIFNDFANYSHYDVSFGVRIKNIGKKPSQGPISFIIKALPVVENNTVINQLNSSHLNILVNNVLYPIDNANWNSTNISVNNFTNEFSVVSLPNLVLNTDQEVIVGFTLRGLVGYQNNQIVLNVEIQDGSAGDNIFTNNSASLNLSFFCEITDKSGTVDSDGDGVVDQCDVDSDDDGIPDAIEDKNKDGIFKNDDTEGNILTGHELGDGIANYLDLDSDNDGILDLHESGIPISIIQQIDADMNGVIDANVPRGNNGIADILETSPDSGVMKYPVADTNGDGLPDFLDIKSNGAIYDLYAIGKSNLDTIGLGYIDKTSDVDEDGIMNTVDTNQNVKGAPGSPISPYAVY